MTVWQNLARPLNSPLNPLLRFIAPDFLLEIPLTALADRETARR